MLRPLDPFRRCKPAIGLCALLVPVVLLGVGHARKRPSGTASVEVVRKSHRATPVMIATSAKSTGKSATPFRALADDGQTYELAAINAKYPVVLLFIKDGCPCSKSAEPYFHKLHAAGGGWIPFFGVIDGDEETAARWVMENSTPFPVLADCDRTIIRAYGAESSAYVALIAPGGTIERLWPGYSAGMFRELTQAMSRLSGRIVEDIDADEAPDDLYSGCPFD